MAIASSLAAHLVGRVNGIDEDDGLVGAKAAHQSLVVRDEGPLLGGVELSGDQIGLAIVEPETMQQRDQPSMAILDTVHLGDPFADHARVERQGGANPLEESGFLIARQAAAAARMMEYDEPGEATLGIELVPGAHAVVVDQQRGGDLLAAPAVVEEHEGVGSANDPSLAQPITGQCAKFVAFRLGEEARANHAP